MYIGLYLLGLALVVLGLTGQLKKWGPGKRKQSQPSPKAGASVRESRETAAVEALNSQRGSLFESQNASGAPASVEAPGDWSKAPSGMPAMVGQEKRRTERILLKIPVQVEGTGTDGNSFSESTVTLSINRDGAVIPLRSSPRPGESITITKIGSRHSCPFRLCDFEKDPSGQVTAWGVECLEMEPNFWGIRFPEKPAQILPQEKIDALLECVTCLSPELSELTVSQYRSLAENGTMMRDCSNCGAMTEWKFKFVEVSADATSSPSMEEDALSGALPGGIENRRERRILAKVPVRLRRPAADDVENTTTENISHSGLCCAASMELSAGDPILVTLETIGDALEEEKPARVVWRRTVSQRGKILYGLKLEGKEPQTT